MCCYVSRAMPGLGARLRCVPCAAEQLTEDPTIYFVLHGGWPSRRPEIEAFVRSHGIRNFACYPYVPRERVADALAAGDIHLITLLPAFAGIAVPGKLYGIMAAARPALFVGPAACESADAIRAAAGGVVIDPADGDAATRVVAAIRHWRDDPAAGRAAGARALAAYVRDYQREPNCQAFAEALADRWPDICALPRRLEWRELRRTSSKLCRAIHRYHRTSRDCWYRVKFSTSSVHVRIFRNWRRSTARSMQRGSSRSSCTPVSITTMHVGCLLPGPWGAGAGRHLEVGSATHAVQTARIMERIEPVLLEHRADWILVYGDVTRRRRPLW